MRSSLLITSLLLVAPGLQAQGFGPELLELTDTLPGTNYQSSILVKDFDMDGRPDLVVWDPAEPWGNLLVCPQQPDGSFGPGQPLDFGFVVGPQDFALSDLDADGLDDLVGLYEFFTRTRLGLGGGAFGPMQASSSVAATTAFVVADFDADAAPDVLIGAKPQGSGGKLWRARGLGDGTFAASELIAEPRIPTQLLAADLDVDGDLDLVCKESWPIAFGNNYATSMLNDGAGHLTALDTVAIGPQATLAGPLDLDVDGLPDLLAWTRSNAVISGLMGQGDGHLAPRLLAEPGGFVQGAACADMDADGFLDLAFNHFTPGQPSTITFRVQRLVRLSPEGDPLVVSHDECQAITIANLDEDGLPDLATVLRLPEDAGAELLVYRNGLGPLVDLGLAAPGGPTLSASGTPAAGEAVSIAWHAGGPMALVVGLGTQPVPLGGGLLLPPPTVVLFVAASGALQAHWPAGVPGGTHVAVQGVALGSTQPGNTLLFVAQP